MKKDLLKMADLSHTELNTLLMLAAYVKKDRAAYEKALSGKTLGMIFRKSSTRTRVSFEAGMVGLGGHALFLSGQDLQLGRGEPIKDTARVLSRYLDCLMIRTFAQAEVEELAEYASIPVINGLTDYAHPCQVLADLLTVQERFGHLEGLTACYIGDGNNMANSLIVGALSAGMSIRVATPSGYEPDEQALAFARSYGDAFALVRDPMEAAQGCDVAITDVWASMGQEQEAEQRKAVFAGYQINDKLIETMNAEAIVLHCLPAHRGEEITDEVFERYADIIFDEAENRMHAQKAVLLTLMGAEL